MTRADRSRLRQRLREHVERLSSLVDRVPLDQPTLAAVVYQLRTRCGKPRCRCGEGKLHTAWCVSYAQGGKRKLRTLAPLERESVGVLADRYRRWRQVRAEIGRLFRQMLGLFDRLERSHRVRPARAVRGGPQEGA